MTFTENQFILIEMVSYVTNISLSLCVFHFYLETWIAIIYQGEIWLAKFGADAQQKARCGFHIVAQIIINNISNKGHRQQKIMKYRP
jgi:hypothetical protein